MDANRNVNNLPHHHLGDGFLPPSQEMFQIPVVPNLPYVEEKKGEKEGEKRKKQENVASWSPRTSRITNIIMYILNAFEKNLKAIL